MTKKLINKKNTTNIKDPYPNNKGSYLAADKIIRVFLYGIWSILIIFGILTFIVHPQWLADISKPGRAEEAMANNNEGNSCLYQAKEKNSETLFLKAMTNYQKALEIDTSNYEAMANLGITYLYLNKLDEAKATFEKLLIKDTINNYHTYTYLGDMYGREGNNGKALECYLNAAKKHPDPSYPLRKAGLLSEQLKNSDDAIRYLKQSIEVTKNFENFYKATLMDARNKLTKDMDTINLEIINKALQKTDFTADLKRYDKTIFEQTLKSSKDLGYAYMYLGDAYFFKPEYDSAYANYQLSTQYYPSLSEKIIAKQNFALNNMALKNGGK
jgi:tetratricopeptide (TPR) repeat protein